MLYLGDLIAREPKHLLTVVNEPLMKLLGPRGLSLVCSCQRLIGGSGKYNAKQKHPGCKNVRGQSEATMVISNQKL